MARMREFTIRPHPHLPHLVGIECACGHVLYGEIDFAVEREHDLMACHSCQIVGRIPEIHPALDAAVQAQDIADALDQIANADLGGRGAVPA